MLKYKHILVAADLTQGSHKIVEEAYEMAQLFQSKLSIVHVVEPLPGYGYAFVAPADIEQELLKESKKELKKLSEKYQIATDNQYVQIGPTKVEILDVAEREQVDLIILGTHGRSGLSVLLGSTANAVIQSAKCDVLTVRVFEDDK